MGNASLFIPYRPEDVMTEIRPTLTKEMLAEKIEIMAKTNDRSWLRKLTDSIQDRETREKVDLENFKVLVNFFAEKLEP